MIDIKKYTVVQDMSLTLDENTFRPAIVLKYKDDTSVTIKFTRTQLVDYPKQIDELVIKEITHKIYTIRKEKFERLLYER